MPSNNVIQLRKGTSTEWTNANPVLASGEPGYDSTNKILKIGDGSTVWSSLNNHSHSASNITDFTESVQDVIGANGFLIAQSGISISYDDNANTLTITGGGGGGGATITNAGDNRILTSDGTSTGINGEANLTFDSSTLVVSGSIRLGDTAGNRVQFFKGGGAIYDYSIAKEGNHLAVSTANDGSTFRYTQFGYHSAGTWTPKTVVNNYNGKVGILNTTPSYELDVAGTAYVSGSGIFATGINLGTTSTNGIISGLSTTNSVPALRFQSVTANHTAGNHVIFDWYKNTSTRLFYIDGAGSFTADATNGNWKAPSTSPASGSGAFIGNGMRRNDTNVGMDFAWGESIVSTTEPGIDLFPIGGTHITNGILFRLSKNSTKTSVALQVSGSGNVGIGTTSPASILHALGSSSSISTPILTVESSGSQIPLIFRTSGTNRAYVKGDSGGNLAFGANAFIAWETGGFGSAYERMRVTATGDVGVGTTSPAYKLDVVGGGKFTQLYPTVVSGSIVSGAVDTDVSTGQIFNVSLTENITLNNPTNGVDGVTIRWRLTQDGSGGRTVTLDSKFQIPSSASNPLPWSTAANAMDMLAATYDSTRDKWDVVAFVPGY